MGLVSWYPGIEEGQYGILGTLASCACFCFVRE